MTINEKVAQKETGLLGIIKNVFVYDIVGTFYPTSYQEMYAKKHGIDPKTCTYYSLVIGTLISAGKLAFGASSYAGPSLVGYLVGGVGLWGLYGLVSCGIRFAYTKLTNRPIPGLEWELLYRLFGVKSKKLKKMEEEAQHVPVGAAA